ncbi:MAG: glycosyltransferase family 4 protein [Candidatus Alcyoniella australis]|nr:glycosyltransferase family 4 protein [Candidatus Alcyoniella australis]
MVSVKVWHATDAFYPRIGGVERVVQDLTQSQRDLGFEVLVATRAEQGSPAREQCNGIDVVRVPFTARPTPLAYASTIRGFERTLRELAREHGAPDLIHTHLTLSGLGAARAARAIGVPLVATFYGPWHAEFLAECGPLRERGRVYAAYLDLLAASQRRMQAKLMRSANQRVALSEFSATALRELCDVGCTIVPGSVDLERFTPRLEARKRLGWPAQRTTLLSVRRLARRMGLERLIDAVAHLARGGHDLDLVIAGQGELRHELERRATDSGVADRVRFAGMLSQTQLPLALSAADLFVLPSIAHEHFGLVILESIACGTPVVGSDVGAIPELLGGFDPTLVARGSDPDALAATIAKALPELERLAGMCGAAWRERLAQRYSPQAVAQSMAQVYAEARA